jgi:hypothetical protein
LFVVYCPLLVVSCLLSIACCPLPVVARCQLSVSNQNLELQTSSYFKAKSENGSH